MSDENEMEVINEKCSICLEVLAGVVRTIDCRHRFHQRCLQSGGLALKKCPLCRANISRICVMCFQSVAEPNIYCIPCFSACISNKYRDLVIHHLSVCDNVTIFLKRIEDLQILGEDCLSEIFGFKTFFKRLQVEDRLVIDMVG